MLRYFICKCETSVQELFSFIKSSFPEMKEEMYNCLLVISKRIQQMAKRG